MVVSLHDLPYEKWTAFIFNRPVTDPLWFNEPHAPFWKHEVDRLRRLDYLTRLFHKPRERLHGLSPDQVGVGLWYLVHNTLGDYLRVLSDLTLPATLRHDGVATLVPLFHYFAEICDEEPIQRARHGYWAKVTCQMFWDVCALWPDPTNAQQRETDDACLDVMKQTLRIDHATTEAATIHGLGLWARAYPAPVAAIIDDFLSAHAGLSEELHDYAIKAKQGLVS